MLNDYHVLLLLIIYYYLLYEITLFHIRLRRREQDLNLLLESYPQGIAAICFFLLRIWNI